MPLPVPNQIKFLKTPFEMCKPPIFSDTAYISFDTVMETWIKDYQNQHKNRELEKLFFPHHSSWNQRLNVNDLRKLVRKHSGDGGVMHTPTRNFKEFVECGVCFLTNTPTTYHPFFTTSVYIGKESDHVNFHTQL